MRKCNLLRSPRFPPLKKWATGLKFWRPPSDSAAPQQTEEPPMTTTVGTRHAIHYTQSERMTGAELRESFMIETLFEPSTLHSVYTHYDRMLVAGAMPAGAPLKVGGELAKLVGTDYLLERRELGLINIGGAGRVIADGTSYDLQPM